MFNKIIVFFALTIGINGVLVAQYSEVYELTIPENFIANIGEKSTAKLMVTVNKEIQINEEYPHNIVDLLADSEIITFSSRSEGEIVGQTIVYPIVFTPEVEGVYFITGEIRFSLTYEHTRHLERVPFKVTINVIPTNNQLATGPK